MTMPTILESITALAMNFPRNLNLEQTSSTFEKLSEGPSGLGNSPTGLWTYSGVLAAPEAEEEGREENMYVSACTCRQTVGMS